MSKFLHDDAADADDDACYDNTSAFSSKTVELIMESFIPSG